jgi:hypothetical protein
MKILIEGERMGESVISWCGRCGTRTTTCHGESGVEVDMPSLVFRCRSYEDTFKFSDCLGPTPPGTNQLVWRSLNIPPCLHVPEKDSVLFDGSYPTSPVVAGRKSESIH